MTIGGYFQFQDKPLSPPSASAALREASERSEQDKSFSLQFPATAWELLQQGGFRVPLCGFVASIGVTNIISTFTDSSLRRAGFLDPTGIELSGAAFQLAIVLGGIFVGGYVDRTKRFKRTTMLCLNISGVSNSLQPSLSDTLPRPQPTTRQRAMTSLESRLVNPVIGV